MNRCEKKALGWSDEGVERIHLAAARSGRDVRVLAAMAEGLALDFVEQVLVPDAVAGEVRVRSRFRSELERMRRSQQRHGQPMYRTKE